MPCGDRLSEREEAAAAKARCTRCDKPMIDATGVFPQMSTITWRQVGGKGVSHFNLCSACTPPFVEFLAGP